jgi:hypothetical protein
MPSSPESIGFIRRRSKIFGVKTLTNSAFGIDEIYGAACS